MRRLPAALTVLMTTLFLALGPGTAAAGGPTSVLLVAPGSGQTASLYSGDDDYELLAELLGAFGGATAAEDGRSGTDHATGYGITVTWLIHDVQVWRVDYVYPGAAGGPWVATRVSDLEGGTIWDSEVAWHRVVDSALLGNLLGRLGVLPASGTGGAPVAEVPAAAPPAVVDSPAAPSMPDTAPAATRRPAGDPGGRSRAPWLWAVAGATLGAALGGATVAGLGRRRLSAEPVPGEAGSVAEPAADDWAPDDVLSSAGGRG